MSRILRRPMFRGGRVSSYGTGIAAPLVPGYQGGGQIGGGIIYGKPMADGRYGFADLEIDESTIGANVVKKAKDKTSNWEDLVALEEFSSVPKYDEDFLTNKFDSFVKGVERRVGYGEDDAFQTDVDLGMQLQPPIDPDDAAFWKIYNEDPEQAYKYWKENISTWGTKQKKQMEHAKKIGADVDYGIKSDTSTTELTDDQKRIQELEAQNKALLEGAVEPEVDAKTAVAENKELFRDLLGYDKAKGQDISDMLLGFAGAEGDDTWSKAKSFFQDEAKRPGRAQKISDAAGTLAIQDYIAGKRSKEQIDKLKSIETFKLDEQIKKLYPQADDKWLLALRKAAGRDGSLSSDSTIKSALAPKAEKEGKPINANISKKDVKELLKDKDDFEIGYTIVTLGGANGRKVIVEKTATDIGIREDLLIY